MSERKVLTKYYPPDFDPSAIKRTRGPKTAGPKVQTVRLMAPFPMKCLACGEYIYKGRKFNARKESPAGEMYLNIQIHRFYIRCTRCSSEITFKTDPKNMDYTCERGAQRNFEPWRKKDEAEETVEERLDRLEREEADEAEVQDSMRELEAKANDARREEQIADALDNIRMRNAQRERAEQVIDTIPEKDDSQADRLAEEQEDQEIAQKAFRHKRLADEPLEESAKEASKPVDANLWRAAKKKKKDRSALIPGLVRKT